MKHVPILPMKHANICFMKQHIWILIKIGQVQGLRIKSIGIYQTFVSAKLECIQVGLFGFPTKGCRFSVAKTKHEKSLI